MNPKKKLKNFINVFDCNFSNIHVFFYLNISFSSSSLDCIVYLTSGDLFFFPVIIESSLLNLIKLKKNPEGYLFSNRWRKNLLNSKRIRNFFSSIF